jgi:hypothetical protein
MDDRGTYIESVMSVQIDAGRSVLSAVRSVMLVELYIRNQGIADCLLYGREWISLCTGVPCSVSSNLISRPHILGSREQDDVCANGQVGTLHIEVLCFHLSRNLCFPKGWAPWQGCGSRCQQGTGCTCDIDGLWTMHGRQCMDLRGKAVMVDCIRLVFRSSNDNTADGSTLHSC